jgi:hypothetical protein
VAACYPMFSVILLGGHGAGRENPCFLGAF